MATEGGGGGVGVGVGGGGGLCVWWEVGGEGGLDRSFP